MSDTAVKNSVQQLSQLYQEWFGKSFEIFNEGDFQIHIFKCEDDLVGKYWTYLTAGVSSKPMTDPDRPTTPDKADRTEFVFYATENKKEYRGMLGLLATFPHIDQVTVGFGDTVTLTKEFSPALEFTTALLLSSPFDGHREAFENVKVDDSPVDFLWIVPITEVEKDFKKKFGIDKTLELLDESKNPVVFTGKRKSFIK